MGKTFTNEQVRWAQRAVKRLLLVIAGDMERAAQEVRRWVR